MNCKTEAIVLHTLKYGDSRLIVDLFTREAGRLSFIVPLPKTPRSKIKKQYFQPLTLLFIESDLRPQADLQHLRDATLLQPLPSLLSMPTKLSIALFVAEFLYYALRDEQPPLHRDFLYPEDAARIQLLMRMDFPTMHLFRLSHTDRNRILDTLLLYYRLHLPAFPELRSLSVLKDLWGD